MDYNLDIFELVHIQVISGDVLSSPDIFEGKVVLTIIRNPVLLAIFGAFFFCFFSNSGIPPAIFPHHCFHFDHTYFSVCRQLY